MLYSKIDENNALQRKVEQLTSQNQQLLFAQQLASLQAVNGAGGPASLSTSPVLSAAQNTATAASTLNNQHMSLHSMMGGHSQL